VRAPQDTPVSTWIMTFASDSRSGDLIQMTGREQAQRLLTRTFPEASLTFEATWRSGAVEYIRKDRVVQIFDPDGSVAKRVRELSLEAVR
jgi:hypothetical protein